jgi:hypothetical protein
MNAGIRLGLTVTLLLFIGATAQAETIGGSSCSTCQGSIYTLSGISKGSNVWDITLSIDTSGYYGGPIASTYIDAISIKVSTDPTNVSLISAPILVSDWQVVPGKLSAKKINAGAGWESADWITTGPGVSIGGTLSWTFRETIASFLTSEDPSIKVRYVSADGEKVGALLSEPIKVTKIPEPTLIVLLGIGLMGVSTLAIRRNKR